MIDLADELARVTELLETAGVGYALVGGLAVGFYGYPRATKDIDLLVLETALAAAVGALVAAGYRSHSGNVQLAKGKLELRRLNRFEGTDFMVVDLLIPKTPDLIQVFDDRRRVGGKGLWLATVEGLKTLKRLRGSHRDLADIDVLDGKIED